MTSMRETDGEMSGDEQAEMLKPQELVDWLWRPWFAKLWWAAIVVFHGIEGVSALFGLKNVPPPGAYLDYLAMLLHPQALLVVLGMAFLRARIAFARVHPGDTFWDASAEEDSPILRFSSLRSDSRWAFWNAANPLSPLSRNDHR